MIEYDYSIAGDPVRIYYVEHPDELDGFHDFIRRNVRCLSVDSETTGLDIYSSKWRCRLVQFGNGSEAYVLPVELGGVFEAAAIDAIKTLDMLIIQNASYDLQVFERAFGIPMESLWPKVVDTKILSHLVDPRGVKEGGSGHKLEELTAFYIDPVVAEGVKGSMTRMAQEMKTTQALVWKKVALDNPTYQLYAGMDPVLTYRLWEKVKPLVPGPSKKLIGYEHRLAEVCSYMERTGILVDVEYTKELSAKLQFEASIAKETASDYGCENVNSTEQVADVLEAMGYKRFQRTTSGKRQVNDDLLVELSKGPEPVATFAKVVIDAKRFSKQRSSWVQKFLTMRDPQDRVHAGINPLQARTGRMSITGIPAQTLPPAVRGCFIADPGQSIVSVDYATQELRVLAELSGDANMIQAFKDGADLHLMTAQAAFGPHVTKDMPERSYAKTGNFAKVYGGGAETISKGAGISIAEAQKVITGFNTAYPSVGKYSRELQRQGINQGYVITPYGRRLPVDPDRAYAALNYVIQSTSRDITGRAIIRLHEAGFTKYMRLPIHDEVLFSFPSDKAEWGARKAAEIMKEQLRHVLIDTDASVYGRSWGDGYTSK